MRAADLFNTRTLLSRCARPCWCCAAGIESIMLCCSSFTCSPGRWGLQHHHKTILSQIEKPKNSIAKPRCAQILLTVLYAHVMVEHLWLVLRCCRPRSHLKGELCGSIQVLLTRCRWRRDVIALREQTTCTMTGTCAW